MTFEAGCHNSGVGASYMEGVQVLFGFTRPSSSPTLMSLSFDIPKLQTAAVIEALKQDLVLRKDFPVKQPSELAPGECLVKMEYTGVCHSDLHIRDGDWHIPAAVPVIGGHEGVGTVVAIGEHTTDSSIKVGDRVGVKWIAKNCGRCDCCQHGIDASCDTSRAHSSGYRVHGTFCEYLVSYVSYVTPIPEGLDGAQAAPFLCAGLTVYGALKNANATIGNWVAIPGAGGGLGHLAVQIAVSMGLRVVAIDTGEEKRKLVTALGAEKWVDFRESQNLVQDVMVAAGGKGPHAAIVVSGVAEPFNQAIMYLRANGTLVAVGMGNCVLEAPIPIVIAKALKIVGSALGTLQDSIEVLDLAVRGKLKCQVEVRSLQDVNSVLEDLGQGRVAGRVVLKI